MQAFSPQLRMHEPPLLVQTPQPSHPTAVCALFLPALPLQALFERQGQEEWHEGGEGGQDAGVVSDRGRMCFVVTTDGMLHYALKRRYGCLTRSPPRFHADVRLAPGSADVASPPAHPLFKLRVSCHQRWSEQPHLVQQTAVRLVARETADDVVEEGQLAMGATRRGKERGRGGWAGGQQERDSGCVRATRGEEWLCFTMTSRCQR